MCATISTSPDRASVATQVINPSASNFGVSAKPSSTSWVEPGAAKLAACWCMLPPIKSRAGSPPLAGEGWGGGDCLDTRASWRKRHAPASTLAAQQGHEADLLVRIVAERAEELRRDG